MAESIGAAHKGFTEGYTTALFAAWAEGLIPFPVLKRLADRGGIQVRSELHGDQGGTSSAIPKENTVATITTETVITPDPTQGFDGVPEDYRPLTDRERALISEMEGDIDPATGNKLGYMTLLTWRARLTNRVAGAYNRIIEWPIIRWVNRLVRGTLRWAKARAQWLYRYIQIGGQKTFLVWALSSPNGHRLIRLGYNIVEGLVTTVLGKSVGLVSGVLKLFGSPGKRASAWLTERRMLTRMHYDSFRSRVEIRLSKMFGSEHLYMKAIASVARYAIMARFASYFLPGPLAWVAYILLIPLALDRELRDWVANFFLDRATSVWERADAEADVTEAKVAAKESAEKVTDAAAKVATAAADQAAEEVKEHLGTETPPAKTARTKTTPVPGPVIP